MRDSTIPAALAVWLYRAMSGGGTNCPIEGSSGGAAEGLKPSAASDGETIAMVVGACPEGGEAMATAGAGELFAIGNCVASDGGGDEAVSVGTAESADGDESGVCGGAISAG
jgi:hypothetical protein